MIKTKSINNSDILSLIERKKNILKLKRLFDIVASLIGIVILSPVLIFVSIIILISSPGPIIYKQIRVGKKGILFNICKFRTMVVNSDKQGLLITVGKDSRITRTGFFLRKFKIDELPQLFNVIKGDMSFVGPRPEVEKYVKTYTCEQKIILEIRPGITDYASIMFRDESSILAKSSNPEKTYISEIVPKKIDLNLIYLRKMSILEDIKIILLTLWAIVKK